VLILKGQRKRKVRKKKKDLLEIEPRSETGKLKCKTKI
jgi:hypothetical protein